MALSTVMKEEIVEASRKDAKTQRIKTLSTVTKEEIVEALDELSPDKLAEVGEFIEFLRFKGKKEARRVIRLGGLWQDLPPVTDKDIAEARREMWGRLVIE